MENKIVRDKKGRFAKGNRSRVGIPMSEESRIKRTLTRRKTDGYRAWNKGLTKETNEVLKRVSESKEREDKISKGLKIAYLEGRKINPSNIEGVSEKMSKTKKRLHNEGKIKPWNKGLTKEIDKRVMNQSIDRLGEKNPAWLGGKSFEPYDINFNNKFKRAIRKRDNYICMKCGIHSDKLNRALSIHHINYDKFCTIPENCISVCAKCNSEVNFNRKHWIKFFQSLLSERYGYQYTEKNEIKVVVG